MQVEEEQRRGADFREQYLNAEKRSVILQAEKDEFLVNYEQLERARKQAEYEAHDMREQNADLVNQNAAYSQLKRKLESEMQIMRVSLREMYLWE